MAASGILCVRPRGIIPPTSPLRQPGAPQLQKGKHQRQRNIPPTFHLPRLPANRRYRPHPQPPPGDEPAPVGFQPKPPRARRGIGQTAKQVCPARGEPAMGCRRVNLTLPVHWPSKSTAHGIHTVGISPRISASSTPPAAPSPPPTPTLRSDR